MTDFKALFIFIWMWFIGCVITGFFLGSEGIFGMGIGYAVLKFYEWVCHD